MRRFIKTSLFFAVLFTIGVYSNAISSFIVDTYNNSIEYLESNLIATVRSLAF